MGKDYRKILVFAFAFGWILTASTYAETIQFVDPLDPTMQQAPLQFEQISQGIGSYQWETESDPDSTKLVVPPLMEGKQAAVENFLGGLPWLTMVAAPGDPGVKLERPLGSIGRLSSSLAILRERRAAAHDAPDGYQTGLNEKKSRGAVAAFRLKF